MKKIIIYTLIFISAVDLFSQQELSFDEAVKIALANNYSIQMVEKQQEIAENSVTRLNAGMLPRFNIQAGRNFAINNSWFELAQSEQPIIADNAFTETTNASATLNWTIFDGLAMFVNYDKLEEQRNKSQIELQIAIETTIRELVNIYYSAVIQKENIETLKTNVELTKDRYSRVKDRVDFGAASSIQLLNAKVDMNADSTNLMQSELQFNNSKRSLNFVLGNSYEENYSLNDEISFRDIGTLQELIDKAKSLNTSINAALKDKKISMYDKKLIIASMFPRVAVTGGYTYNRQEADQGFFLVNQTEGLNAGVNFSWDLYNIAQAADNKENAEIRIEMMDISINQIEAQVEMSIRNAYDNYQRQKQILQMEESNLQIAQENYDRTQDLYDLGQVTTVELRQAQLNLLRNRQRINNSKFMIKTAETELLLLSGQLLN
jgi:outer membrane protein TolC